MTASRLYRISVLVFVLALILLSSTGCMFHTPGLAKQRQALERQIPGASFDRTIGLKFGRMSLGLARSIARASLDDSGDEESRQAIALLRKIKGVQVGVYRTLELPPIDTRSFRLPSDDQLRGDGWYVAAEVRGEDHVAWALAKNDARGMVRQIQVGALDEDELVLVRIRGNVQEMLDELVERNVLDLPGMIHADLDPEPGEPIATDVGDSAHGEDAR